MALLDVRDLTVEFPTAARRVARAGPGVVQHRQRARCWASLANPVPASR